MKKITLEDLDKLKSDGWEVSADDRKKVARIVSDSDLRGKIKDIAAYIGSFSEENKASNDSIIGAIMANTTAMQIGFKALGEALTNPKNWECDVRRNKAGYISKIFLRQTN
jgi:hypothetical protein